MAQPTVHQSADNSRVGWPFTIRSVSGASIGLSTRTVSKTTDVMFDLNLDKQPPTLAVETAY